MDIQIKISESGEIEVLQGQEELEMELSMGLAVECLEVNSQQVYLIENIDGQMIAKLASEATS